jgi:hypothetical protein
MPAPATGRKPIQALTISPLLMFCGIHGMIHAWGVVKATEAKENRPIVVNVVQNAERKR